jgi:putative MATE family efflux protein
MELIKQTSNFFSIKSMIQPHQIVGDLPESNIVYKNFLKIAWPSALESILVSLVSSVDTIMVGSLGDGAIAAVGITNQPKYILLAMVMSLNIGITALVARRKGEQDKNGANKTLRAGILLSAMLSFITALLGYIFAPQILLFTGAEASYFQYAIDYFQILMVSIFFTALNLTVNAAQRGIGKTKISMRTNITANVVNIIFDYLLINGIWIFPRLEVKGAAIATCLGAIAGCCMSFGSLLRKDTFLSLRNKINWKITNDILKPITKISGSAFIEQVFIRVGFLSYAIIVAKLGETAFATHLICMNILNLSFCFGDGFSIAASSLVGQNLGAKRSDMSIIYGKVGQRLAFIVSSLLVILFIGGRNLLVSLYTDSPEVIALGSGILIIIALTTHAQTSQVVISGCLRGAGDTLFVAITSMMSVTIIRPLLTFLLCFPVGLGLYGAWIALLVDQMFRLILNFARFTSGKWTKIIL